MNKAIMEAAGFGAEMKAVEQGKCPFCGTFPAFFRDELSKREYKISGLCQQCQDDIWGKGDD